MHVKVRATSAARATRDRHSYRAHVVVLCGVVVTAVSVRPAHAATPAAVDTQALVELEQRAVAANAKEQAFLYADLADRMTILASHQLADGEIEAAEATLEHMESCTAKMEGNLKGSKSLKKTELLLHTTNRRLSDMVRAASMEAKPHVQAALKRLNAAQTSLLALIFEK